MPNFKLELTTAGAALVAKGLSGTPPTFFALALGDGTPTVDPSQVQELAGEQLRLPIVSKRVVENGIYLTGQIKLDSVESGFNWTEFAVLASDPDTKEEKIYCYGYDAAGGTLPGDDSNTRLEGVLEVLVKTYGMPNATVMIDHSLIYLNQDDLNAHNTARDAHSDLFAQKADLGRDGKVVPEQMPDMDYVARTGDTMTGNLTMSSGAKVTGLPTPTENADAVPKNYVDQQLSQNLAQYLKLSGGTMTGNITMSSGAKVTGLPTPTENADAVPKNYVDQQLLQNLAQYLKLSGGTMTGNITMANGSTVTGLPDPEEREDAVSFGYLKRRYGMGVTTFQNLIQGGVF